MNISVVANPNFPVPPFEGYGGTQRGAHDLSVGLAERENNVFVAASGDSNVEAYHRNLSLIPIHPVACASREITRDQLLETYVDIQDVAVNALRHLTDGQKLDVINLRWERVSLARDLGKLGVPMVVSIPSIMPLDRVLRLYDEEREQSGQNSLYGSY